jgi:hypothetical protein
VIPFESKLCSFHLTLICEILDDVQIVDRWLSEEWTAQHAEAREARLQMPGVPHHQGNRNLAEYAQAWVCETLYVL